MQLALIAATVGESAGLLLAMFKGLLPLIADPYPRGDYKPADPLNAARG